MRLTYLTLIVAFLFSFVQPAHAGKFDTYFGDLWERGNAEKNLHILDNATFAYFYDMNHGEKMGGVISSVYTFRHFSADFGVIKTIEADKSGFPVFGLNYKIGAHLAGYDIVKIAIAPVRQYAPLLRLTNVGGFYGRDFNEGLHRYGFYAGLKKEFGNDTIGKLIEALSNEFKKR